MKIRFRSEGDSAGGTHLWLLASSAAWFSANRHARAWHVGAGTGSWEQLANLVVLTAGRVADIGTIPHLGIILLTRAEQGRRLQFDLEREAFLQQSGPDSRGLLVFRLEERDSQIDSSFCASSALDATLQRESIASTYNTCCPYLKFPAVGARLFHTFGDWRARSLHASNILVQNASFVMVTTSVAGVGETNGDGRARFLGAAPLLLENAKLIVATGARLAGHVSAFWLIFIENARLTTRT